MHISTKLSEKLSGTLLNQNQAPESSHWIVPPTTWVFQEFVMPADIKRIDTIPPISGFQVLVGVEDGLSHTTGLDYTFEYKLAGVAWQALAAGTAVSAPSDGDKVWMNIFLENPVDLVDEQLAGRFRLGLRFRSAGGVLDLPVDYNGTEANVLGKRVVTSLVPNEPWAFDFAGTPSILTLNPAEDQVYYSAQQGANKLWYAQPNPLLGFGQAYAADGTTPLTANGDNYSFCFRVLGLVADDGIDFLGNTYRSLVRFKKADSISTSYGADPDAFWLSKPNPSKFAVESLYFDVRPSLPPTYDETGTPTLSDPADDGAVIDRVLVDPITPGAYFNIYYSNEGDPGSSDSDWENKLWTHVPTSFRMTQREVHTLPEPIKAKYMKVEFSHLQARYYAPGSFTTPTRYKKHPKWVMDYFIARLATEQSGVNPFLAGSVSVIYDALDLAYLYFDDESKATFSERDVSEFFLTRGEVSDQVDPMTLERISLVLQPYQRHPATTGWVDTLISRYARETVSLTDDYPVEAPVASRPNLSQVSSVNRDRVVWEQSHPVTFFFVPSRHKYREVEASFEHDRAYFVGVRELSFSREHFMAAYDSDSYVDIANDGLNVEVNDFEGIS